MTEATTKPLPKSLHTVTVLVRVARHLQNSEPSAARPNNETAVDEALVLLGHRDTPDTYCLGAAAVKQMNAADTQAKA
jgi:hypothetical protein